MAGLRFLSLRLGWVLGKSPAAYFSDAAHWAFSLALYSSVLLALMRSVIERIFAPAAIICIGILAIVCAVFLLENLEKLPAVSSSATRSVELGGPGLILATQAHSGGTVTVLLEGPSQPASSRVVSVPQKPMVFQPEFAGADSLSGNHPADFTLVTPPFLQSVASDLRLSGENMRLAMDGGRQPFLIYAGSLVFFLCSLMFVFRFGVWPMANFFLGILAFRGVLALETFLNSAETQEVLSSYIQDRIPLSLAVPVLFTVAGILANLYSFLAYLARRQARHAAV